MIALGWAAACGRHDTATAVSARLTEAPAAVTGEGADDLLLLDAVPTETLVAAARAECAAAPSREERVRCRMDLANRLTRAALDADSAFDARRARGEATTNDVERRFAAARNAVVDTAAEPGELEAFQDEWRASGLHAEPTEADEALDAELLANTPTLPMDPAERRAFILRHTHVPGIEHEIAAAEGGGL